MDRHQGNPDKKFYYYEVMDRTHILLNNLDSALSTEHPGLDENDLKLLYEVSDLLGQLYQSAGRKFNEAGGYNDAEDSAQG